MPVSQHAQKAEPETGIPKIPMIDKLTMSIVRVVLLLLVTQHSVTTWSKASRNKRVSRNLEKVLKCLNCNV